MFGTYVDNEGPEQTSEHMWTENVQTRLRNICGQRRSKTDLETYVNNEDPDQISERIWAKTDFGTYVDNEDPEQTSKYGWTEKA